MSAKLREMVEKRNRAITQARELVDKAEQEKRNLTDDEKRQCDAWINESDQLWGSIDRETKLIEEERRSAEAALKLADKDDRKTTPEAEARSKAFRKFLTDGVQELTPDERRAITVGTDTQGGFLTTPQEFVKSLIVAVKDMVFVRGISTVMSTNNANGLGAPSLDTDLDDFEWTPEIKEFPEDTSIAFGKRELEPHPLKKLIKISEKLLRADGMNPESILMDRCGYKLGVTHEKAFMTGSGAQQPLGVFTASNDGIPTSRDYTCTGATAANGYSADDLISVKYNEKAQYQAKSSWIFHRDGVKKVALLKDGEGQYIFKTTEQAGGIDRLLGRPLYMSEYAPNTFTASLYVGIFGDFSYYWIVDSLAMRIKRLVELFAATSQIGFLIDAECDAMPVLAEAFTRIKTAAA